MLPFLAFIFVLHVKSQNNICLWGRDGSNAQLMNGDWTYEGISNGGPYYSLSIDASFGLSIQYLWRSATQYYITDYPPGTLTTFRSRCTVSSNDPISCGQGNWRVGTEGSNDPNVFVQDAPCPQWDCDSITTTQTYAGCDGPFNQKVGQNEYYNGKNMYWYFNRNYFAWLCSDTINYGSGASYSAISDGWTDVVKGQSIYMNFQYPKTESFQVQCIKYTSTVSSTATNMPSVNPTKSPTNMPTISPTNMPTISPTNMPTISPTDIPTISPTNIPTILPTNMPTSLPTNNLTAMLSVYTTNTETTTKPTQTPSVTELSETVLTTNMIQTILNTNLNDSVEISKSAERYFLLIIIGCCIIICCCIPLFCCFCCQCVKLYTNNKNEEIKTLTESIPKTPGYRISDKKAMNNRKVSNDDSETIIEIQKNELFNHKSSHSIVISTDLNRDNILNWLLNDNEELQQYVELFAQHGYIDLNIIKSIVNVSELQNIGIINKQHQTQIMDKINKLWILEPMSPQSIDTDNIDDNPDIIICYKETSGNISHNSENDSQQLEIIYNDIINDHDINKIDVNINNVNVTSQNGEKENIHHTEGFKTHQTQLTNVGIEGQH